MFALDEAVNQVFQQQLRYYDHAKTISVQEDALI